MLMKRSKFLTFVFSLIPGAGQMFMGFMKTGVSLMAAFFLIIFISNWLSISPLLFILPLLWFYSFFDCINRRYCSDEEFLSLEDKYLFSFDRMVSANSTLFQQRRLFAGILVLLLGWYLLFNSIIDRLYEIMPDYIVQQIRIFADVLPRLVIGIIIVGIGIRLIVGKKKESEVNA